MKCNCNTIDVYEVTTDNLELAVTLDTFKEYCHLDFLIGNTSQDAILTVFIRSAMSAFELVTRRTLMIKEFLTYRSFWNCFELQRSPLITIDAIKYFDSDAVEQTVDSGDYYIGKDPFWSKVLFDEDFGFPSLRNRPDQINIAFTAGYATDSTEVPADIALGILQYACFLNANRGDCDEISDVNIAKTSGAFASWNKYIIVEI